MSKNGKRIISLFVSLVLIFTSFSSVYASESEIDSTINSIDAKLLQQLQERFDEAKNEYYQESSKADITLQDPYSSNEEVNVIVKLEGNSIIEDLNNKGSSIKSQSLVSLKQRENAIISTQSNFLNNTKKIQIPFKTKHQYTYLLNGLSGEVKFGDINKLKSMPGVLDVRVANVYQPEEISSDKPLMYSSAPLIGADQVWENYNYTGKDTIVAIVDTGVNYYHPAFGGTGIETLKLGGKEDFSPITGTNKGYNTRVIGGYNWADSNNDIVDRTSSQHGVHVAGTVAGDDQSATINGESKPFKGIAYESKILAEKVFSNDEGNSGALADDIIAGIEHAVKNGADVINMSLGSSNGAVVEDDPEIVAVENATKNGVVVTISAGNSAYSTSSINKYPLKDDRDYSMVGTPSVSPSSISVASSENSSTYFEAITLNTELNGSKYIPISVAESAPVPTSLTGSYSYLEVGLGKTGDYTGKNIKGKVALIQRGENSFSEKVANAAKAGAIAAIIYNRDGDNTFVNMDVKVGSKPASIPAVFIRNVDGVALKSAIASNPSLQMSFLGNQTVVPLAKDTMSDFSSWGPEPGLNFKPTLTAPGGNIYSSVGDHSYAVKGGTSMAAPHVTGASAVIIQSFRDRGLNYTPQDVRAVLSNTAKILINPDTNTPYSVRHQGAGRIQLDKAIETNVSVQYQGEPGVALKEFQSSSITFNLVAKNFGNKDVSYDLSGQSYQDLIVKDNNDQEINTLTLTPIQDAVAKFSTDKLTVPAGKETSFSVTLTLPSDFEENQFVDGWVTLKADESSAQPELNIPFFGFYGDWNAVDVIDRHWADPTTVYGNTGLYIAEGNTLYYSGLDSDGNFNERFVAFSPYSGSKQLLVPIFTFLRNVDQFEMNILDANHSKLVDFSKANYIRKHTSGEFSDYGIWDGTVNGEVVPDGEYYIQAIAKPYGVNKTQETLFPVRVDTKPPSVNADLKKSDAGNEVIVNAIDESGIEFFVYEIFEEGVGYITSKPKTVPAIETKSGFTTETPLPLLKDNQVAFVYAVDHAGNETKVSTESNVALVITKYWAEPDGVEFDWILSDDVADVQVLIDHANPYTVKELFPNWRNQVFIPLLYDRHDITLNALNDKGEVLSTFETFGLGKTLYGKKTYTVNSLPEENNKSVELSFLVASDLVARVDIFDASGNMIGSVPTNGYNTYYYTYDAPMGSTKLVLKAYNQDGNQSGLLEVTVKNNQSHILFNHETYLAENGSNDIDIDFTRSNVVQSARLYITGPSVTDEEFMDFSSVTENVYHYNYGLSSLDHADYKLTLKAYDKSGKSLAETSSSLRVLKTGVLSYTEGEGNLRTKEDSYPIHWNIDDESSVSTTNIYVNDQLVDTTNDPLDSYLVDLKGLQNDQSVKVVVETISSTQLVTGKLDYTITKDNVAPEVVLSKPAILEIYAGSNNSATVSATTFDMDIAEATISAPGMEIPVNAVLNVDKSGKVTLEGTIPFTKEGLQNIELKFKDIAGNEGFLNRRVFVDFTSPLVSLSNINLVNINNLPGDLIYDGKVNTNQNHYTITGVIQDALSSFDLYINDNQVLGSLPHKQWNSSGDQRSFKYEVSLQDGDNSFLLYAFDGVGNQTTINLTITRTNNSGGDNGSGGGYVPPSTTPTTTPTTPTLTNNQVGVGTVTETKNADGTTSATTNVSSDAINNQLKDQKASAVSLDLSDVKFDTYKDVTVTFDKVTADKLASSGKGLTLTNSGFTIEIPANALYDFINKDGFKIIISLSDAGKGTVRIQSVDKTAIVSPVVSVNTTSGKLTKSINITLKPNTKSVSDKRKVGVYYKDADGKWAYVGTNSTRKDDNIVLTISKLGSYAAIEYNKSFADIEKHWAKDEIEVIASQHVTTGKKEDTFAPNDTITRSEFVALLDRIMGQEKEWGEYAKMIGATNVLGREEMVIMMVNAMGTDLSKEKAELSFKDKDSISTNAQAAVAFAFNNGLIKGVDGNIFAPGQSSSRSQVAVILYRLMKFMEKI